MFEISLPSCLVPGTGDASSKFHFKEIDWIVYLPSHGNEGSEYEKYEVAFRDRKRGRSKSDRRISLGELMRESVMKDNYPHTVGFFLASSGKGTS